MYWLTALLGVALGVAPFLLGYADNTNAMLTSIILGVIVLIASVIESLDEEKARWEYWIAGFAGIFAIAAPFLFGFSALTSALWASVAVGAVIVLLSGYEILFVESPTS